MIDRETYTMLKEQSDKLLLNKGYSKAKLVGKPAIQYFKSDIGINYTFEIITRNTLSTKVGVNFDILIDTGIYTPSMYVLSIRPNSRKSIYSYEQVDEFIKILDPFVNTVERIQSIKDALQLFINKENFPFINFNGIVGYFSFGLLAIANEDNSLAKRLLQEYLLLTSNLNEISESGLLRRRISESVLQKITDKQINELNFVNVLQNIR